MADPTHTHVDLVTLETVHRLLREADLPPDAPSRSASGTPTPSPAASTAALPRRR